MYSSPSSLHRFRNFSSDDQFSYRINNYLINCSSLTSLDISPLSSLGLYTIILGIVFTSMGILPISHISSDLIYLLTLLQHCFHSINLFHCVTLSTIFPFLHSLTGLAAQFARTFALRFQILWVEGFHLSVPVSSISGTLFYSGTLVSDSTLGTLGYNLKLSTATLWHSVHSGIMVPCTLCYSINSGSLYTL